MEGVYGATIECRELLGWNCRMWDSLRTKRVYHKDGSGERTRADEK